MRRGAIFEHITRIVWSEDKGSYCVEIVDRMTDTGVRRISGACINRVERGFMVVKCEGGEVLIPLHRVQRIIKDGRVVWDRSKKAVHPG